jgi:hypothetical protein
MFTATGWDLFERVGKPPVVKSSGDEVTYCLSRMYGLTIHAFPEPSTLARQPGTLRTCTSA